MFGDLEDHEGINADGLERAGEGSGGLAGVMRGILGLTRP